MDDEDAINRRKVNASYVGLRLDANLSYVNFLSSYKGVTMLRNRFVVIFSIKMIYMVKSHHG